MLLPDQASCSPGTIHLYTELLAEALGEVLIDAMLEQRNKKMFNDEIVTSGLENTLVNATALESRWEVERVWTFRKLKLAEHLAAPRKPLRVVNLVDSNVVRCALSKGRSSSRGLTPVISKFGSVSVAMGLYFCLTQLGTSQYDPRSALVSAAHSVLNRCIKFQVAGALDGGQQTGSG